MESEKVTEAYLVEQVRRIGGEAYKFVSPGRRFVPDRLCVLPLGLVYFVEVKSEGQVPSPGQAREIERLGRKGHYATWVCTKAGVDKTINAMEEVLHEHSKRC